MSTFSDLWSPLRRRLWGTSNVATQEEVVELTNQFYVTLRACFAKIQQAGDPRNQRAFDRVEHLLHADTVQNWSNAYEVEQLLVHLFDDDAVAIELSIRILEARSILRPELAALYEGQFNELKTPPGGTASPEQVAAAADRRRMLLARLVDDLQWRYIVNEATRRYSKLITRRTAVLSVMALIGVLTGLAIITFRRINFNYGDLSLVYVAGLAGAWGATFSMLATLRTRLAESSFDDLKLMKALSVLISRALIGAGAACILFFFLLSGLLGGSAFPTLQRAQASETTEAQPPAAPLREPVQLPKRDLALLVVWCFIAGFSEQLIPGLLASTEAKAGTTGGSTTDRFRPTTGTTVVLPAEASTTTPEVTAPSTSTNERSTAEGQAPKPPPPE